MASPLVARAGARLASAALAAALALAALGPRGPGVAAAQAQAQAQEDWFLEFEDVCSRTQDAMTLTSDELRALIGRCDRLGPRIDALDPSRRKVYRKRLQLCRDLYRFVLDTRDAR